MPTPASSINVVSQIGQEASPGAGGTAGKKLQSLTIEPADELNINEIMSAGHRFDTGSAVEQAWTSFNVSMAQLLYTEPLYCLENLCGTVSPTTVGIATKKRVYDIALTGGITPKTWLHEWGDPADNVNKYSYGLLTDFGESYDREGAQAGTGAGIAQLYATGSSFDASPTAMANVAVAANHVNYYLDTSWANLGTTQITDEINSASWSIKGIKAARWAADRSQASFKGHVDLRPKTEVKLTLHEDSVARAIVASLKLGNPYYLRIDAQGPYTENLQTVTITGTPTGGSFTLSWKGVASSSIAYNANSAAVATALASIPALVGNVTVTGGPGPGTPYIIQLTGALAQDATLFTHTDSFTGGASPAASVTASQQYYLSRRDICLRLTKIAAWKDSKGIYARELTGVIAEDSSAGHAMLLTSQTLEASL